jgi:hypothetical protein
MTTPLAAFIPTFQDDTDVLVNAVRSLVAIEGLREILVCDTGPGVVRNNPRPNQPTVPQFCKWAQAKGWPVVYSAEFQFSGTPSYGELCNYYGKILEDYPWIIYLGSDEMLSAELCANLPDLLKTVRSEVSTIAPKMLSLYPDEQTYSAGVHSTYLCHGRIYRPKKITWTNILHEHQKFNGEQLQWDRYLLHFRQLFERRCLRQCWLPIEWPEEEAHVG